MVPAERFCREKFYPKGYSAVGQYLSLFHRYGYIYKRPTDEFWLSAKEHYQLTDSEILKAAACVHPKHLLGARAGQATRFGVLDIDVGSKYHNEKHLAKIQDALADAGIVETFLYRSSHSGGWHLYIFFDEPVSSRDLRNQLVQLLRLNGFDIAAGTLEVFPAPGDSRRGGSLGNGLRLPLQPGFAWLDRTGEVLMERDCIGPVPALDSFMRDVSCGHSRHDFHQLKATVARLTESQERITAQMSQINTKGECVVVPFKRPDRIQTDRYASDIVKGVFQGLPPGIIAERWVAGRNFAQVGLTGESQRAEATTSLSHYLFYGDPEHELLPLGYGYETERQWAIEKILADKHNGLSKEINRGRADAIAQIGRAAAWVPPERRGQNITPFVRTIPIAWQRNSANLKTAAAKKIAAAVADFEEFDQTFSVRDLQLKTGCSNKTLYKHQQLWKPAQTDIQNRRLAAVTPEYNVVVGADSQEIGALPQSIQKNMPPGRLAARRIIHEIKMRALRDKLDLKNQVTRTRNKWDKSWRKDIDKITPDNFVQVDTKKLRALLPVYLSAIGRSPDYESETWLRGLITQLRAELDSRPHQLHVVVSESDECGFDAFFEAVTLDVESKPPP
ncbi:MAG: hypothetical protein KGS72_21550 [Cyanobacteria bacterium REEB67]|nr:hypothetical protein [Cyanobacteria bacterium REEB67]